MNNPERSLLSNRSRNAKKALKSYATFDGKPTNRYPKECIVAQRCNVATGSFAREVAIEHS